MRHVIDISWQLMQSWSINFSLLSSTFLNAWAYLNCSAEPLKTLSFAHGLSASPQDLCVQLMAVRRHAFLSVSTRVDQTLSTGYLEHWQDLSVFLMMTRAVTELVRLLPSVLCRTFNEPLETSCAFSSTVLWLFTSCLIFRQFLVVPPSPFVCLICLCM